MEFVGKVFWAKLVHNFIGHNVPIVMDNIFCVFNYVASSILKTLENYYILCLSYPKQYHHIANDFQQVENAFSIVTSHFRIFRRTIISNVDCAVGITISFKSSGITAQLPDERCISW